MSNKASATGIPGTEKIVSEAWSLVTKSSQEKIKPAYVEKNFSEVCELLFYKTYSIYQEYEKKALEYMSDSVLKKHGKETYTQNDVKKILREATMEASSLEKSLKQSRASRAGKAFELIVSGLLRIIGIPHEKVTKEDKKTGLRLIDMVVPDTKTAIQNPDQAKFLSLKTSLKDRWKLAVEDQRQGQRTYLLTLLQNEKLTEEVAEKIVGAGIILYVPDKIKDEQFPNKSGIRKLTDLPKNLK